ncbi:flagellar basal body P-ring formation chaperone FlgA [Pseudoalteromonas tunicata]|uniref:flagellar basal body P-ring formation chaperone FlgA n=1 Tax=Pseudoalteromonas tunicata TaxID=314281 RepID=UPI00058E4EEA|nr:flagellar basal body P-ring formation chaperone FlgA [Pseudoalteromonas tunicata]MDP4982899.1 flagellar basal body P-ring formation chaperone FlgA [Pseudoalteromonas tunicata]
MSTKATNAKTYSSTELQNLAIEFISSQQEPLTNGERNFSASKLDDRIDERHCESELEISSANANYSNRQTTVQIKCLDEIKWLQYVQVRTTELAEIVITQNPIAKGQLITAQDIVTEMRPTHLVRNQNIDDIKMLIGSRATRSIRAGNPINLNQICMICKGDKVTIYAKQPNLVIKTNGEALENGLLGENISVQNSKSGKKIQAQVMNTNDVIVNL